MSVTGLLDDTATRSRHRAYGVQLDCEFALPLSCVAEGRPPALRIAALAQPPALVEQQWSGAVGEPLHATVLSDGRSLTVERGRRGDHLVRCGEHAFHLSADLSRLACSPPRHPDPAWQRALLDWVTYSAAVLGGAHCIHAAAVRTPGGVLALAAPPGGGKTTLAVELLAAGATFFCDDVLTVERREGLMIAHPGPPFATVSCGDPGAAGRLGVPRARLGEDVWVAVRGAAREPAPLAAIVILDRVDAGPREPEIADAGLPDLRGLVVGFPRPASRERSLFSLLAAIASQARLLRLRADRSVPAAILARSLASHLRERGKQ